MTIARLIKETKKRIELFDLELSTLIEKIHEARFNTWDYPDLLDEKKLINAKRQMCIQFIADLECLDPKEN